MWYQQGKEMKRAFYIITFVLFVATGVAVAWKQTRQAVSVPAANIEIGKTDLIRVDFPRPNQTVQSPLTVKGKARGSWFFEASFPIVLTDWDGRIIAEGIATAQDDWMTSDFVPFEAVIPFVTDPNVYSNRGALILRKDNPSGLPEHDDAFEIPVVLEGKTL